MRKQSAVSGQLKAVATLIAKCLPISEPAESQGHKWLLDGLKGSISWGTRIIHLIISIFRHKVATQLVNVGRMNEWIITLSEPVFVIENLLCGAFWNRAKKMGEQGIQAPYGPPLSTSLISSSSLGTFSCSLWPAFRYCLLRQPFYLLFPLPGTLFSSIIIYLTNFSVCGLRGNSSRHCWPPWLIQLSLL